jgi:hypothetical protein
MWVFIAFILGAVVGAVIMCCEIVSDNLDD